MRRIPDRIFFLSDLASDCLAWTALGAPRDENQIPVRCLASSCLLFSDPHRISWQALAMSGIAVEVRTWVRAFASQATNLQTARPDPELVPGEADSLLDEVRAFMERLRAHQATSADGLRVSRHLLRSAIALDPVLARNGAIGNLTAAGALALLEQTLPIDRVADRVRLAAILEEMADALPDLVAHAAAHLEDDDEDELGDDEATAAFDDQELENEDEELQEDDVEDGFDLGDALTALDARLRVTEQASEGADVAFLAACALLIQGVDSLSTLPPTLGARVRANAAADALLSPKGEEHATAPLEADEDSALLEMAYAQAAALLEAEIPELPKGQRPVEVALSELDTLVGAMEDVTDEQVVDGLAGALALIGGAAETLRVGVALGHEDADTQRRMAAALGVLDPIALADRAEVRAAAAQTLRELARSARGTTAVAATTG